MVDVAVEPVSGGEVVEDCGGVREDPGAGSEELAGHHRLARSISPDSARATKPAGPARGTSAGTCRDP